MVFEGEAPENVDTHNFGNNLSRQLIQLGEVGRNHPIVDFEFNNVTRWTRRDAFTPTILLARLPLLINSQSRSPQLSDVVTSLLSSPVASRRVYRCRQRYR